MQIGIFEKLRVKRTRRRRRGRRRRYRTQTINLLLANLLRTGTKLFMGPETTRFKRNIYLIPKQRVRPA
jgi:hypothetical protein